MRYLLIILLLLFGMADGVRDATNFHPSSFENQEYWNNSVTCDGSEAKLKSWKNKYKQVDGVLVPYENKWYHVGKEPAYEEAFPLSTTLFVSLTDGFHMVKMIQMWLMCGILLVLSLFMAKSEYESSFEKLAKLFKADDQNKFGVILAIVTYFILIPRFIIGVGFYITYNLIL